MLSKILNALKRILRRYPIYWEARYAYLSHTIYRKLGAYLYHRFWTRYQIKRSRRPLDRPPSNNDYSIHLLCGHQHVDMLLWTLASWHIVITGTAQFYIHDDGTFTVDDRELIKSLFPYAKIIDYKWATEKATTNWLIDLPAARFYRADRKYIWAVKLIDPYFISRSHAVLILDTDVIWFRQPVELINSIHYGQSPLFWPSPKPNAFLFKNGMNLRPELTYLNTGLVYYKKEDFDLGLLEDFCQNIGPQMGPPLLDQPGYAYILGSLPKYFTLPIGKYIMKGPVTESTVARHDTGPVREQFWFEGVKLLKNRLLS